ncbi:MAG: beta-lactamase family protein [Herminiimonas sp.]|nr:beta-lactamase family protein [Herminiimonas sp.]
MPISRRKFIVASASAPFLSSCATDLSQYSDESILSLSRRLGVWAASYVTFDAGKPSADVVLSGCSSARPVHAVPIFQAASLTKPVIAFVALKLVQNGKLDLNAPVSRYLPHGYIHRQNSLDNTRPALVDLVPATILARIPIGTLLNHSSGLPNWTSGALAPEFVPGERWQYSGEGYVLLQAVITAVTSQDIESCVSTYVFHPLGMRHSRLRRTADIRQQLVEGVVWLGIGRQLDFIEPNAAASLYTTAGDYAKLISALLADNNLLSLTVANPVLTEPKLGLTWGYGWGIETASGGPYLWHWGNNPGFRSFAMMSLSSKNGFVLFTNSERGMPLAASLARSVIPGEHEVFRFYMLG